MSLQQGLVDLAIVSLIAALTPIIVALLSRTRVPQVVVLIVGGVVVGPQANGVRSVDLRADKVPAANILLAMRVKDLTYSADLPLSGELKGELGRDGLPTYFRGKVNAGAGHLIADLASGAQPFVDPTPYRPGRFSESARGKVADF